MRVHYLSDVIAGYLAGLLWATLVVLGTGLISYFAIGHPEVAAEEKDVEKGVGPLREAMEHDDAEPRVGPDIGPDIGPDVEADGTADVGSDGTAGRS